MFFLKLFWFIKGLYGISGVSFCEDIFELTLNGEEGEQEGASDRKFIQI